MAHIISHHWEFIIFLYWLINCIILDKEKMQWTLSWKHLTLHTEWFNCTLTCYLCLESTHTSLYMRVKGCHALFGIYRCPHVSYGLQFCRYSHLPEDNGQGRILMIFRRNTRYLPITVWLLLNYNMKRKSKWFFFPVLFL